MQPFELPEIITHSQLLNDSFARWMGRSLVEGDDVAHALFHAPFPLVSHGTEADPLFRYANRLALSLWEVEWEQFIGLPSRRSAEAADPIQSERNTLLATAMARGWVGNYAGQRISARGKRFHIRETILWNVVDETGTLHGQAARIGNVVTQA